MTDSQNIDDSEKLNIIFKEILGFPSTSENISYYEELNTKFNTYTLGENVLLQDISQYPDFNINGKVKSAAEIGLHSSDFFDYSYNPLNKSQSSIVDDSTGTVRRFKYLKLQQTYGTENSNYGASWFKLDNSYNNVLEDSLQYNYKSYYDLTDDNALKLPYLYEIFTERSLQETISSLRPLPFGIDGGNWLYNYKNGILFFSDFNNLAQQNRYGGIYNINNNNKPVISVYKYIGKKNINNLYEEANLFKTNFNKLYTYVVNLSHKITNLKDIFTNNININTNYSNRSIFTDASYTTTTDNLIDLSNSFFNTITPFNINSNILVTINVTLLCSYGNNERLTLQLWRDLSMIMENRDIGSANALGGLTIPYNITHLDENINSGLKKYYLKYKCTSNSSAVEQGIINVRTPNSQGYSDILLREIQKLPGYIEFINFSNKSEFDNNRYITTNNNQVIDLSSSFFNVIKPCNNNFILVNINVSLLCSYAADDSITIQLWNNTTLLHENKNITLSTATGGFVFPFNITYLDENYDNSTKKYYLKYYLQNGTQDNIIEKGGIVNITTNSIIGSSTIILQEYRNIAYTNKKVNYNNVVSKTSTSDLVDLSNIVFQTINSCNNSNIIVYINVTLVCCYAFNETLIIELWRDNTLIMRDSNIGTQQARGLLSIPYNVTYLDENVTNGNKKYYLKYKCTSNSSAVEQGIIDIKTLENFGSSNILLNEITNTSTISNKQFFDISYHTTATDELIDLSNLFFNTISLSNKGNIMININVSLLCSYALNETITLELWRDSTMLMQDISLGVINATGGFLFPYNLTYLDTSVNSGIIKYYLKYKISRHVDINNYNIDYNELGLVNIRTQNNPYGSSCFFLRQI